MIETPQIRMTNAIKFKNEMLLKTQRYMVIDVFMFLTDKQQEEIKIFRNVLNVMIDNNKNEIENGTFIYPSIPSFV
jgi:hypothetical protein